MPRHPKILIVICFLLIGIDPADGTPQLANADEPVPIGAARIDITPDYPVRLSGYGNRRGESDGVAQKIWARALALGGDVEGPAILITVENCGMTPAVREQVLTELASQGINGQRLVISVSHTHSAPCLTNWAPYLFSQDIPEPHQQNIDRYTRELTAKLVEVAREALKNRRPGNLYWTTGKVGFAVNRRMIQSGSWAGFGEQGSGPVDRSLPMLAARDTAGNLIAVVANYACHCTTLGGDFNQIAGDWAGYAQQFIEADHPGAVALITIGCGADANPRPRGSLQLSQQHGRELADEVRRLLSTELTPISNRPECRMRFVDLPFAQLPSPEQWAAWAKQGGARGYHARKFLDRVNAGEQLAESISYPVATWCFGDDLAMIFLGGEVVVDYAIRMKQLFDAKRVWISAYCNDVPCYIASKRVLREGGYEADSSMYYYARPNRLAPVVEDIVVDTAQKLLPPGFYSEPTQQNFPLPQSPDASRAAIQTSQPDQLVVELVACEPLVVDPVAFDWGPDGRLWVVEMRDYPNGLGWNGRGDALAKPGGRVKVLDDDDGDGRYDRASIFLDGLSFPTGIKVWRDGILVTAAPEILFAKDEDGDDVADSTTTLYRGFGEGNQQHRVNGLRWGLDNWLYVGNGDSGGSIKSLATGEVVNVSGRDLRIQPDRGKLEARSGQTQFGICRDDWGNWFGGNNSNPIWHYLLEDRYLKRNPHVAPAAVTRQVPEQPGAAPVFPVSRTLARFNDPSRANRFTSACSPIVYRDSLLGDGNSLFTFVCEPVHNLVHREILEPQGSSFKSRRPAAETESEFLASTDAWFRPSMVRTGPDGCLWIADMYRFVIEHPTWIPEEWQRKLDLRAGDDRGRIYRVRRSDRPVRSVPKMQQLKTRQLVPLLASPNGWQRDMAQQLIYWRQDKTVVADLEQMLSHGTSPVARLHALCSLDSLESLSEAMIQVGLADRHPGIRRHAVRLAEGKLGESERFATPFRKLVDDSDVQVKIQLAYTLGEWEHRSAGELLGQLIVNNAGDAVLMSAALSSINTGNLPDCLSRVHRSSDRELDSVKTQLLTIAAGIGGNQVLSRALSEMLGVAEGPFTRHQIVALEATLRALQRKRKSTESLVDPATWGQVISACQFAARIASDTEQAPEFRLACIRLLGVSPAREPAQETLVAQLNPRNSTQLQLASVDALAAAGTAAAGRHLLADWREHSPVLRSKILDVLLSRPIWTELLVQAMEEQLVSAALLSASHRQQLASMTDLPLRERASKLVDVPSSTNRRQVLADYQRVSEMLPDRAQGKLAFDQHCSTCHRLNEHGNHIGPDLAALTDKSTPTMLAAILDPNRAVEGKFLEYKVVTEDGRLISGVLTNETAISITLTANDGKQQTVLRSELDQFQSSGKSLMPEGMEKDLSPQQIANVIAYIRGFQAPPKPFPNNRPVVVNAKPDGSLRLSASQARIYGPSLVFEQTYRNLGYWHSVEDQAVWMAVVPRPGRYRVSFDYACHPQVAGKKFRLSVAGETLGGTVAKTGSWDDYQTRAVGELNLSAGPVELLVRSDGPIDGALIDLRTVILAPVSDQD